MSEVLAGWFMFTVVPKPTKFGDRFISGKVGSVRSHLHLIHISSLLADKSHIFSVPIFPCA